MFKGVPVRKDTLQKLFDFFLVTHPIVVAEAPAYFVLV